MSARIATGEIRYITAEERKNAAAVRPAANGSAAREIYYCREARAHN